MDSNGGTWPTEPKPVDPGGGTRDDRLRMLRHMRQVWNALNTVRRERIRAEVEAARPRQAEVAGYWGSHRVLVRELATVQVAQRQPTRQLRRTERLMAGHINSESLT